MSRRPFASPSQSEHTVPVLSIFDLHLQSSLPEMLRLISVFVDTDVRPLRFIYPVSWCAARHQAAESGLTKVLQAISQS